MPPEHNRASVPGERLEICAYFDGGLKTTPTKGQKIDGACSCVIVGRDGALLLERIRQIDQVTSNVAEYRGLLLAIRSANMLGAEVVHIVTDSELVAMQVGNFFAVNNTGLAKLHGQATGLLMKCFRAWSISHVPRAHNSYADWLCNVALRPDGKVAKRPPKVPAFMEATTRDGWVT